MSLRVWRKLLAHRRRHGRPAVCIKRDVRARRDRALEERCGGIDEGRVVVRPQESFVLSVAGRGLLSARHVKCERVQDGVRRVGGDKALAHIRSQRCGVGPRCRYGCEHAAGRKDGGPRDDVAALDGDLRSA